MPIPASVPVRSQRHEDFFAEVVDGTWTPNDSDGGGASLLDQLVAYVRGQHASDIPESSDVSLLASVDAGVTALTSDDDVRRAVESSDIGYEGSRLLIAYATRAQQTKALDVVFVLDGLVRKESPFTFRYATTDEHLLNKLKAAAAQQMHLPGDSGMTIAVTLDGDAPPQVVPSDRALVELLQQLQEHRGSGGGEIAPLSIIITPTASRNTPAAISVHAHWIDNLVTHAVQFSFSYALDQERLLESLKDATRHALELTPLTPIHLSAAYRGEEVPLTSDSGLLNFLTELCSSSSSATTSTSLLELNVRRQDAAGTAGSSAFMVPVHAHRGSETVELQFTFSLTEGNLLQNLRADVGVELEMTLDPSDVLFVRLASSPIGSEVALQSTSVLRDLLLQCKSENVPLEAFVRRVAATTIIDQLVRCTLDEQTAEFQFRYSLDQDVLLQLLLDECKAELELMPDDTVRLHAQVDGDTILLRNDRELREMLFALRGTGAALELLAEEPHKRELTHLTPSVSAMRRREVSVTYGSEVVRFTVEWVLNQDGLLEHLIADCRDALDLLPSEPLRVAVVLGSEEVTLQTDANARELLTIDDSVEIQLRLLPKDSTTARSVDNTAEGGDLALPDATWNTATKKDVNVSCTLGDDTAAFAVKLSIAQDGLLDYLLGECKDELDLLPSETIRAAARVDGDLVPIASDAILRELLLQRPNEPLVLIATVITTALTGASATSAASGSSSASAPAASLDFTRSVRCTMEGEVAQFPFRFRYDHARLLDALLQECKAELDLMPGDLLRLTAVVGGETVTLRSNHELREVLSTLEPQSSLDLIAEPYTLSASQVAAASASAAGAAEVTLVAEAVYGGDDRSATIHFRMAATPSTSLATASAGGYLAALKSEIRQALALDSACESIQILCSVDDETPVAIRTDEDVASLVPLASTLSMVKFLVALPQTAQQLYDEKPLNRVAELNALLYDWADILSSTSVEAADLKLVINHAAVHGSSLPQDDPVHLKLNELANDEGTLRVDDELLPFLENLVAHLSDADVSEFCHSCRDVIEFMVDRSPLFRLRRSISEAFRALSVQGLVHRDTLLAAVRPDGNFVESEDLDIVLQGFPDALNRRQFTSVLEHLFGDSPQDVADIVAVHNSTSPTKSSGTGNGAGQREVFALRRNRLLIDVRHALDGVSVTALRAFAESLTETSRNGATGDAAVDVAWATSCLSGGPQQSTAEAVSWLRDKTKDDVGAYNLVHQLLHFTDSTISLPLLSQISLRLSDPLMEPAVLLATHGAAAHGLVTWAVAAAKLTCHNRRELFPPVSLHQPRPPSARRPDPDDGPRTTRGFSSPHVIQRLHDEAAAADAVDERALELAAAASAAATHAPVQRFSPRLRHLTNDLQVTESSPSKVSYRELRTSLQSAEN